MMLLCENITARNYHIFKSDIDVLKHNGINEYYSCISRYRNLYVAFQSGKKVKCQGCGHIVFVVEWFGICNKCKNK
jgi:hypothetical protein